MAPPARTWAPTELAEILTAYAAGEAAYRIAKRYRAAPTTISELLRAHGVRIRPRGELHRHHTLNEAFFDVIDTEEKAYWLGFLAADGCVQGNQVSFELKRSDEHHVAKFRAATGSSHALTRIDGERCSNTRVTFHSDQMVTALARHGVGPNKVATRRPANLAAPLIRHYWRGAFDGDGTICRRRSDDAWVCSFVGPVAQVTGFAGFCRGLCETEASVRPGNGRLTYQFQVANGMALAVFRAMYDGATIALGRKHARYLEATRG